MQPMTRQEIQQKMDELAHKYVETRDKTIIEQLYHRPALRIEPRAWEDREGGKDVRTKNREGKSQYGYKLQGA